MSKLIAAAFVLVIVSGAYAQDKSAKLSGLSWLTGCWEDRKAATGYVLSEQWMKAEGGMMLGVGRTVRGDKASDWEFMRIEQTGDGLTFFAKPKANPDWTAFPMVRMTASEIVFENSSHDFPNRVIYRLPKPDLITPRIEGTINGKAQAIDFSLKRVDCR
jgi:hypothetical protein